MIKLYTAKSIEIPFEITKFPDGTSQVWKIQDLINFDDTYEIVWNFENEAEVMHVLQLASILKVHGAYVGLMAPFLPYGRQDKKIANDASFAREIFLGVLNKMGLTSIWSFDVHSEHPMIHNISPRKFFESVFNHDIICYPDHGALSRYRHNLDILPGEPTIHFNKVRDQLTGQITGLQLVNPEGLDLKDKKIIIYDDICDGGGTFIGVAKELHKHGVKQVDLCVSHGIFSKGKEILHENGISNIYTTNSLIHNNSEKDFNIE